MCIDTTRIAGLEGVGQQGHVPPAGLRAKGLQKERARENARAKERERATETERESFRVRV